MLDKNNLTPEEKEAIVAQALNASSPTHEQESNIQKALKKLFPEVDFDFTSREKYLHAISFDRFKEALDDDCSDEDALQLYALYLCGSGLRLNYGARS